jgi:hypothetical protein
VGRPSLEQAWLHQPPRGCGSHALHQHASVADRFFDPALDRRGFFERIADSPGDCAENRWMGWRQEGLHQSAEPTTHHPRRVAFHEGERESEHFRVDPETRR